VIDPDWPPDSERVLSRCLRRSYRLELMAPGQPCVLWVSGSVDPGVHAVGRVVAPPRDDDEGGPVLDVALTRLADHVPRELLLGDPAARDAEVLRMPAGSNPSWLSAGQWAAIRRQLTGPAVG
jgi:hypothetical protein